MKSAKIIISVVLISFFLTTNCLAGFVVITKPTAKNKLRFVTEEKEYVASFIGAEDQKINYRNLNKILEKHFSQEREERVSGLIWENCDEGSEVVFSVFSETSYIGQVGISTDYFTHEGNFFYRIGELSNTLEKALGYEIELSGIRKKGDISRQEIIFSENDFMILKL